MSLRIGIYNRLSGGVEKDNVSLKIQLDYGIKFCKKNNFDYEVFSEIVSGGSLERKEYNKMVEKVKSGELNGIWVFKYDRLDRNLESYVSFVNVCKKYKIRFWVGDEEYNLSDSGDRLNVGFRSMFGEYERERIKERMIIGKEEKLKKGEMIIGNVGYGYKRVDGKIVINENEGKWVKIIYNLFLDKRVKSYNDVKRRLDLKYDDVDKKIGLSLIVKILNNDRYLGVKEVVFNDKKYKYEYEGLVSEDIFNKCQSKLNDLSRLRRRRNDEGEFLLKGKVFCGDCDNNMWIVGSESKLSDGSVKYYRYYSCNNIVKKRKYRWNNKDVSVDCESIRRNKISLKNVDNIVWEILFDVLVRSEVIINEYKNKFKGEKLDLSKKKSRLNYYKNKLDKDSEKFIKEMRSIGEDKIFEDVLNNLKNEFRLNKVKSEKRIKELELDISNIESLNNSDDILENISNDLKVKFYDDKLKNKKDLIEKYIEKVCVKKLDDVYKFGKYKFEVYFKFGGKLINDLVVNNKEVSEKLDISVNKKISNNNNDNFIYILNDVDMKFSSLVYKSILSIVIDFVIVINSKSEISYLEYNIKN